MVFAYLTFNTEASFHFNILKIQTNNFIKDNLNVKLYTISVFLIYKAEAQ